MAYFDNAATTYPKPDSVYFSMDQFYRRCGANAGRGTYEQAQSASKLITDTRSQVQKLLCCPAKQVIFTPTATIALNIIIQGLMQTGVKNVYITPFEHNAVTRTLHHFEVTGRIHVEQLMVSHELDYDLGKIRCQFESVKPDLVIMSHASNVCGLIAPVEELSLLAKQFCAVTVIDMAQTAGLVDCNVGLETIDFAVFDGHKTMLGPTGIAGFIMKPDFELPSTIFGGTGYDSANQNMPDSLPERFEMGTLNIAGIAGLNAALHWIEETTVKVLREKEEENRERLLELLETYDFIRVIGNRKGRDYVGIVSCLMEGISSESAGSIFDRLGIAVRTGLQCAPLAHRFFETYPAGTIRFSVNYFTSDQDFKELREALEYIGENW